MALDSALVAHPPPDEITLRVYGWKPVSLSLGALEPLASVSEDWRARVPILRRPTSGAVFFHDENEIAFCLGGRADPATSAPADLECGCLRAVRGILSELTGADTDPDSIDRYLRIVQKREQDIWLLQGFMAPSGHRAETDLPERVSGPALHPDPDPIAKRQQKTRQLVEALGNELDLAWAEEPARPEEILLANRLLAEQFGSRTWLERR